MTSMDGRCAVCFSEVSGRAKYCSNGCRQKAYRYRHQPPMVECDYLNALAECGSPEVLRTHSPGFRLALRPILRRAIKTIDTLEAERQVSR